jgi:hypothetical protein
MVPKKLEAKVAFDKYFNLQEKLLPTVVWLSVTLFCLILINQTNVFYKIHLPFFDSQAYQSFVFRILTDQQSSFYSPGPLF